MTKSSAQTKRDSGSESAPVAPQSAVSLVAAPRAKPMEVAATTLKQNAALLDRLRRVAMKSERPKMDQPRNVAIVSLTPEDASEEPENPVTTSEIEVVSVPDLPTPHELTSLPPQGMPAVIPEERRGDEPNNNEPITSVSPALRRAKEAEEARAAAAATASLRLRLRAGAVALALVLAAVAVGVGVYSGGHRASLHATTSRSP